MGVGCVASYRTYPSRRRSCLLSIGGHRCARDATRRPRCIFPPGVQTDTTEERDCPLHAGWIGDHHPRLFGQTALRPQGCLMPCHFCNLMCFYFVILGRRARTHANRNLAASRPHAPASVHLSVRSTGCSIEKTSRGPSILDSWVVSLPRRSRREHKQAFVNTNHLHHHPSSRSLLVIVSPPRSHLLPRSPDSRRSLL